VVRGADGGWPGFRETREALVVPGTHLLQLADPSGVAEGLARFLARHLAAAG
jgi:hypothetical protein